MPTTVRPSQLLAADRLLCPRCNRPLQRVAVGAGGFVSTCDRKLPPRPGSPFRDTCSQAVYVWGHGAGVATVIPVSKHEADVLRKDGHVMTPEEMIQYLGIVRSRTETTVAELDCVRCDTPTKRYDLYSGVCRWCRDARPRP